VSEYQYYEFVAVDRPLDGRAMAAVRSLSTRARITPTGFVNTYQWGDFRGDPQALVERYYDAFLYVANWGTRRMMLRLPAGLLDLATAEQYCFTGAASAGAGGGQVVLDLVFGADGGDYWDEEDDGQGWLASIIPARADLAAGDLRLLYLAWLLAVGQDQVGDDDVEPPVPPGLGALPGPLLALADFLHIDDDLLSAAAQDSPDLSGGSRADTAALRAGVAALADQAKTELLIRVVNGDPHVSAELRKRLARPAAPGDPRQRRTVAQLRAAADRIRAERERRAAERRARERAAREKAAARARDEQLDALAREGAAAWQRIDDLIRARKPKEYGQAVSLLVDLRDQKERDGGLEEFNRRLAEVRAAYPNRPALLERLDRAGLTSHA
jgi:hypothetical protein